MLLILYITCQYSNANVFGVVKNAFDGIIPDSCPTYIEGYNNPSIDNGPEDFVRPPVTPRDRSTSDEAFSHLLLL